MATNNATDTIHIDTDKLGNRGADYLAEVLNIIHGACNERDENAEENREGRAWLSTNQLSQALNRIAYAPDQKLREVTLGVIRSILKERVPLHKGDTSFHEVQVALGYQMYKVSYVAVSPPVEEVPISLDEVAANWEDTNSGHMLISGELPKHGTRKPSRMSIKGLEFYWECYQYRGFNLQEISEHYHDTECEVLSNFEEFYITRPHRDTVNALQD